MSLILVTGGCGFLGSHTVVELLTHQYQVIIVDNLSNSSINVLKAIEKISKAKPIFYNIDIKDYHSLETVFSNHSIDAVIHFAGLKSVKDSILDPLKYYNNNVIGSINLLSLMQKFKLYNLVFSYSATFYKDIDKLNIIEYNTLAPTDPYGVSKLQIEQILSSLAKSNMEWSMIVLRYFNPTGAHQSGLIGENPQAVIPDNLMSNLCQVASKHRKELTLFGNDYNTKDGTAIRDYVHVIDIARAHRLALPFIFNKDQHKINHNLQILNLGSGTGYSVLEVVKTFEKVNSVNIPISLTSRRDGDVAKFVADNSKAKQLLNWQPKYNLSDMCRDSWRWQCSINQDANNIVNDSFKNKVAVITRTKNRNLLLKRAINSVSSQTFTDWIMVICNDGGDQSTLEKCINESLDIKFRHKVKVIHNDKSVGMEAASNIAIRSCDSDYIVIHDDDDSWHQDFLKETVSFLDKNNHYGAVTTRTIIVKEQIINNNVQFISQYQLKPNLININIHDLLIDNQFTTLSFLFKRTIYNQIGGYDENLKVLGDWDFNVKYILKADIALINQYLAYYHHRIDMTDSKNTLANSVISQVDCYQEFRNIIENQWLRNDIKNHQFGAGALAIICKQLSDIKCNIKPSIIKLILKKIPFLKRLYRKLKND